MTRHVVITGIGMVTPLGQNPGEALAGVERNANMASSPPFDVSPFSCPYYSVVPDFNAELLFPENKTLRMMNRDAQMAVVAARRAMQDAGVIVDQTYPAEDIGLFGATGLTSLPVEDVTNLIKYTAGEDGSMDLRRFGEVALKRVRPVLSFKILANMPICFVSIFENIQGENAIYTPWEGQGAQAIIAGVRAIQRGDAPCALVGGCDVKTRLSSFISLQQLGVFESWRRHGKGCIPGEGAGFLVLEDETCAAARKKKGYARIQDYRICSVAGASPRVEVLEGVFSRLDLKSVSAAFAAGDGDLPLYRTEQKALDNSGVTHSSLLRPKSCLGNLFAAAAAVELGLAAEFARRLKAPTSVLVDCFGHGSEQAAFVLEAL